MSTTINTKVKAGDENFPRMEKQKLMSSFLGGEVKKAPLKTIQPTAGGKFGSPKNKPLKKMVANKIMASKVPLKVFEDKKRVFLEFGCQTERRQELEMGTQTEVTGATGVEPAHSEAHNDSGIDQEAYDLMVREPIPESYWRELAEERRLSLAEALSENEMLHQSMEELKEENLNLSVVAEKAEYLADVLNSLVGEEETSEKADEEDDAADKDSEDVFHEEEDAKSESDPLDSETNTDDVPKECGKETDAGESDEVTESTDISNDKHDQVEPSKDPEEGTEAD